MALSPKTVRTLNTEKCKNEFCSSRTELNRMFACKRRRQIVTANEKFSFQPLLEHVEGSCWCNRDWQAVPRPSCGNRESPITDHHHHHHDTGCLQIQPNKFLWDFQDTFNKVPVDFYVDWSSLLLQFHVHWHDRPSIYAGNQKKSTRTA